MALPAGPLGSFGEWPLPDEEMFSGLPGGGPGFNPVANRATDEQLTGVQEAPQHLS